MEEKLGKTTQKIPTKQLGGAEVLKISENHIKSGAILSAQIGVDTAENEPPEVSMKWGVPKQAFHPSGTSRGRSASGPVEVALKQLVQLKLR